MPIVYQTTNKINGNIYVGVHTGARRTYLGSGDNLKRAIDKYGKENFTRETLFEGTSEEVLEKEKEIVNGEFIARRDTYNICLGGGMPPVQMGNQHAVGMTYTHSEKSKKAIAEFNKGKKYTPETIAKISKAKKGTKMGADNVMADPAVREAHRLALVKRSERYWAKKSNA